MDWPYWMTAIQYSCTILLIHCGTCLIYSTLFITQLWRQNYSFTFCTTHPFHSSSATFGDWRTTGLRARSCRIHLQCCMPHRSHSVPVISSGTQCSLLSPILQLLNPVSSLVSQQIPASSLQSISQMAVRKLSSIVTQRPWELWLRVKSCSATAGPAAHVFNTDGVFGELAAKL